MPGAAGSVGTVCGTAESVPSGSPGSPRQPLLLSAAVGIEAVVDWALGCKSDGWQSPTASWRCETSVRSRCLPITRGRCLNVPTSPGCKARSKPGCGLAPPLRKVSSKTSEPNAGSPTSGRHTRRQCLRERSLRQRLDNAVSSGSPAAALALYLDRLASLAPHGWDDRAAVETAMRAVEKELGREATAALARSQAAPLLWSKKLRRHIHHIHQTLGIRA